MKTYDVVVVGLGAMGSSALYHSARRGLKALGIEQFHVVPHDRGSHHGSTRIIRKAYFEDPAYVPLLLRAYDLWEELEKETGSRVLEKCGGLMIGKPDSEVVSGALLAATTHGLAYEELTSADLGKRYPQFRLERDMVAVFEPDAGYLHSELAVRSHVQQAVARGAEIRLGTKVTGWTAHDTGVSVEYGGEVVHADKLIVTVGAWAPEFLPVLPLEVERQVLFWFEPSGADLSGSPIYIMEEADGAAFYGFPYLATEGSKVALHHAGRPAHPDRLDRTVTSDEVAAMRDMLLRRIPALGQGSLLKTSVCMYTNTPDLNFIVGHHPDHENVILGLGYSGHGFKFSSVMGELLVGLARDERTLQLPPIFEPTRWK